MSEDLSQVRRHRREKLDALREKGLEPYAYMYDRSHLARDAVGLFEQEEAAGSLNEQGQGTKVRGGARVGT